MLGFYKPKTLTEPYSHTLKSLSCHVAKNKDIDKPRVVTQEEDQRGHSSSKCVSQWLPSSDSNFKKKQLNDSCSEETSVCSCHCSYDFLHVVINNINMLLLLLCHHLFSRGISLNKYNQ